jgi:hypothetical protein
MSSDTWCKWWRKRQSFRLVGWWSGETVDGYDSSLVKPVLFPCYRKLINKWTATPPPKIRGQYIPNYIPTHPYNEQLVYMEWKYSWKTVAVTSFLRAALFMRRRLWWHEYNAPSPLRNYVCVSLETCWAIKKHSPHLQPVWCSQNISSVLCYGHSCVLNQNFNACASVLLCFYPLTLQRIILRELL